MEFKVGDLVRLKDKEDCSRTYSAVPGTEATVTRAAYISNFSCQTCIDVRWTRDEGLTLYQENGNYPPGDFELVNKERKRYMPQMLKRVLLRCQDIKSNKFYEVRLEKHDKYYSVSCRYGPCSVVNWRERGGSIHEKKTTKHKWEADNCFNNVIASKIDRSYREIDREEREEDKPEKKEPFKSPSLARFTMLDF